MKSMQVVELNPAGNFDPWEPAKLNELRSDHFPINLGQKLLFENEKIVLWELELAPEERYPFTKISRDYNWVSHTEGLVITRCHTGKISMLRFRKGHSTYITLKGKPVILDFENIGENELIIHLTEFKSKIEILASADIKSS